LRIGDGVIASSEETASAVARRVPQVRRVDISEFVKADAGVTCMSVVFED
jgi:hypothetical protein